jgi:hypothetical protein
MEGQCETSERKLKAQAHPLKAIFGKDIQYVVPLYQRQYVWRKDSHWEPLWQDVLSVVQQLLDKSNDGPPRHDASPHFLGAVVLDQQLTPAGSLEERHIIDGQQRLTTLQLMLGAATRVASELGFQKHVPHLKSLISNREDLVVEPDDRFKVRPTNVDRPRFDSVMGGSPSSTTGEERLGFSLVQEGFDYFVGAVRTWLQDDEGGSSPAVKLDALVEGLRELIHVVVIDLEPKDNAQVIFETLNARGTPLLAIDLVKNLIFRRAHEGDQDVGVLHRNHWRTFEKSYWREEVTQGRLRRPRSELFLMHWLAMKNREVIAFHQLYPSFRRLALQVPAEKTQELLEEFAQDGRVFESFDARDPGTPEYRFFERLRALDTSVVLPYVLFLFRQRPRDLSFEDRNIALSILESWLVRRMICGVTIKSYNRLVLDWIKKAEAEPGRAPEILLDTLKNATSDVESWPDNSALDEALASMPFYKRIPQSRIKMILVAIENELRSDRTEEMLVPSTTLTVEHVMPQSWEAHWPLESSDSDAPSVRNSIIHLLGNLTLVTKKLNPSMSHSEWGEKRQALNAHSVLLINRSLVDENIDKWDEAAIQGRGRELGKYIKRIWPGPHADWSPAARETQLRVQRPPAGVELSTPPPEALIKRFAKGESEYMLEQMLDEISSWEEVRVRVGKAQRDEARTIQLYRTGAAASFCHLHPASAEMRLRLDPDELSHVIYAQISERATYRVVISLKRTAVWNEAVGLAQLAYAGALKDEQQEMRGSG